MKCVASRFAILRTAIAVCTCARNVAQFSRLLASCVSRPKFHGGEFRASSRNATTLTASGLSQLRACSRPACLVTRSVVHLSRQLSGSLSLACNFADEAERVYAACA
eukprot:1088683-Prymnesium_polylepis.2